MCLDVLSYALSFCVQQGKSEDRQVGDLPTQAQLQPVVSHDCFTCLGKSSPDCCNHADNPSESQVKGFISTL